MQAAPDSSALYLSPAVSRAGGGLSDTLFCVGFKPGAKGGNTTHFAPSLPPRTQPDSRPGKRGGAGVSPVLYNEVNYSQGGAIGAKARDPVRGTTLENARRPLQLPGGDSQKSATY